MKEWRIKHLPIVDKNGALVGMLNDRDIIYAVPIVDVNDGRVLSNKIISTA